MHIQQINTQPNFNGKVVYYKPDNAPISKVLAHKFKKLATQIENEPFDIFISPNKVNRNFFDVAANKTFAKAQKVKEYTVKVQSNILAETLIDAAKEAIEMYKSFISKSVLDSKGGKCKLRP